MVRTTQRQLQRQLVFLLIAFWLVLLTTVARGTSPPGALLLSGVAAGQRADRNAAGDGAASYLEISPDRSCTPENAGRGWACFPNDVLGDGSVTQLGRLGEPAVGKSRRETRDGNPLFLPASESDLLQLIGAADSAGGATMPSIIAAKNSEVSEIAQQLFFAGENSGASGGVTSACRVFSLTLFCSIIAGLTLLFTIIGRVLRHLRYRRYLAWKEPQYAIVIADRPARPLLRHQSSRKLRPHFDLFKRRDVSGVKPAGGKKVEGRPAGYDFCQNSLPSKKFMRPRRPRNFAIKPIFPKVNIATGSMSTDT